MFKFIIINFLRLILDTYKLTVNTVTLRFRNKISHSIISTRNLFPENEKLKPHMEELRRQGYTVLEGHFDGHEAFEKFCERFQNYMDEGHYNSKHNSDFDHSDKLRIEPVMEIFPEVASFVFDETICELIVRYKRLTPGFEVTCYKTVPSDTPKGSSNFHQDQFGDLSIFIALEDITIYNGAAQFVPGSHHKIIKFWPTYLFKSLNSLIKKGKPLPLPQTYLFYDESLVNLVYPKENWIRATAKKGSVFFLDTSGIHRGPYWEKNIQDDQKQSRAVLHLSTIESIVFGQGTIRFQKLDRVAPYLPKENIWGNAVREVTESLMDPPR